MTRGRTRKQWSSRWPEVGAFVLCLGVGGLGTYGALTARAELRARGFGFRAERYFRSRGSPERRLVNGIAYAPIGMVIGSAYVGLWVYDGSLWLKSRRLGAKTAALGSAPRLP